MLRNTVKPKRLIRAITDETACVPASHADATQRAAGGAAERADAGRGGRTATWSRRGAPPRGLTGGAVENWSAGAAAGSGTVTNPPGHERPNNARRVDDDGTDHRPALAPRLIE